LVGCGLVQGPASGVSSTASSLVSAVKATGVVHGGQAPITGSTIQLYAVGSTGYGLGATALISATVTTSDGSGTMDSNANAGNNNNQLAAGNFTITGDYTCPAGDPEVYITATGGNPGLTAGTNNSAIVLIATLTDCNTLKANAATTFITINEVTTVAANYALAQFIGNGGIGAYSYANTGLVNAFATAGNLVNTATGAARATTPNGNGVVPQTEIDTLANILVPCVNSSGPTSASCASLFSADGGSPPSSGVFGAALAIAENPGGHVSTLFGLANANAFFQPTLSAAPNDWTMAVSYASGGGVPSSLALDSAGNVWVTNFGSSGGTTSSVSMMSNLGVPALNSPYSNTTLVNGAEGVAVDLNNIAWIADNGNNTAAAFQLSGGSIQNIYGSLTGNSLNGPMGVAVDGSNDIWFTNNGNNTISEISPSFSTSVYSGGALNKPWGVAIDAFGNAWVANSAGGCHPTCAGSINEITTSGGVLPSSSGYTETGPNDPIGVAIDSSSNVWMTNGDLSNIAELNNSGTQVGSDITAGGITYSGAIAIDGLNTVWVANLANSTLSEISPGQAGISPSTGYAGGNLSSPVALAIDGSGNIWAANHTPVTVNSQLQTVTEFIGLASPTVTPLALAVKNNAIGLRPGRPGISPASIPTGTIGLPYSVTFTGAGGSGVYTWTVTAGLSSLNGIGLTFSSGSNVGTLSGTPTGSGGSYPFTVKLTDTTTGLTQTASYTLSALSNALTSCTHDGSGNAVLHGNYAFLMSGFNPSGHFYDEIGDFYANGTGGITSGNADVDGDQNISAFANGELQYEFSGAYSVGSTDNRGIATWNNANGSGTAGLPATTSYCFAANSVVGGVAQSGKIIQADGSGFVLTGTFAIQNTSGFTTAALGNGYAVGMQGVDGPNPNRRGLAGQFALNGTGGVTSGLLDIASVNCCTVASYSAANAVTPSGSSYTVASTGRGTLTLNVGGTVLEFVTYVVGSGNQLFLMTFNASTNGTGPLLIGTAIEQTTTTFTTASVKGTSVVWSDGTTDPTVSPIKDQVHISQLSLDGSGNQTLTLDKNTGGTVSGPTVNSGTYTVTSAGYLTISGGNGPFFYLYAPNAGFGLDNQTSVDAYTMVAQTIPSGGFTTSSLSGNYALGTLFPASYNATATSSVKTNPQVLTGQGDFTTGTFPLTNDSDTAPGVAADVQGNQTSASNTWVLDSTYGPTTGRFTIPGGGGGTIAGYLVSPTEFFIYQTNGTKGSTLVTEGDHQ
jgi:hypothetical protein